MHLSEPTAWSGVGVMDQNAVGALQVPWAHQPKAHMDVWTPELPQCQNTSELSQRCPARLTCTLHQEGEALSGESFTHSRGYREQRPLPANQHSLKGTQHVLLQRQALGSSSVFTGTSSTTHPLCLCCITHPFNTVSPLPPTSLSYSGLLIADASTGYQPNQPTVKPT